jgi:hypothetical protein
MVLDVIRDDRLHASELLDRGVSPNLRWADLSRASILEHLHYLTLRMDPLQHVPSITSLGPVTPTLLIIAIDNRDVPLAKRLMYCGADVNAVGDTFVQAEPRLGIPRPGYYDRKTTALIESVRFGDFEMAMTLLAHGANVDTATSTGHTAAYFASKMPESLGSSKLLQMLRRRRLSNHK